MNRLKQVSGIATGLGVAAGVVVSRSATLWLDKQQVSGVLVVVISLAIVAILAQVAKLLAAFLIANVRLCRRIILGHQYIEGAWIDLMKEGGKPISFGLTRINIIDGELKISGDDYDRHGEHGGQYVCEFIKYEWPRVRYVYSYQRSDDKGVGRLGYGEFLFDDSGAAPIRYSGHYIDLKDGRRFRFEGWKLKGRVRLKQLQTPHGRKAVIQEWYQEQLKRDSNAGSSVSSKRYD